MPSPAPTLSAIASPRRDRGGCAISCDCACACNGDISAPRVGSLSIIPVAYDGVCISVTATGSCTGGGGCSRGPDVRTSVAACALEHLRAPRTSVGRSFAFFASMRSDQRLERGGTAGASVRTDGAGVGRCFVIMSSALVRREHQRAV